MNIAKLGNAVPGMLLRSPFHRLMSSRYLLLTFVGRKSGRSFRTPVAYLRRGNEVMVTTDSRWWSNLLAESRVLLTLKGRTHTATAHVVQDPHEAMEGLAALVETIPFYGRFADVRRDDRGRANPDDVKRAIEEGRVLIKLQLGAPTP